MIFTFTFPKRTQYETERNYFWEKYFTKSFLHRVNWKYVDYESDFSKIDVIYSPNTRLNIKGSIVNIAVRIYSSFWQRDIDNFTIINASICQ